MKAPAPKQTSRKVFTFQVSIDVADAPPQTQDGPELFTVSRAEARAIRSLIEEVPLSFRERELLEALREKLAADPRVVPLEVVPFKPKPAKRGLTELRVRVLDFVAARNGTTHNELMRAIGWNSECISVLRAAAEVAGVKLWSEKTGRGRELKWFVKGWPVSRAS